MHSKSNTAWNSSRGTTPSKMWSPLIPRTSTSCRFQIPRWVLDVYLSFARKFSKCERVLEEQFRNYFKLKITITITTKRQIMWNISHSPLWNNKQLKEDGKERWIWGDHKIFFYVLLKIFSEVTSDRCLFHPLLLLIHIAQWEMVC